MSARRRNDSPLQLVRAAAEAKPDNSPAACDRRGLLVARVEALVIEYGLDEVAFALRVATEDRGG